MKIIISVIFFILTCNVSVGQMNNSAEDTLLVINKLLDELPKVKNFGGDIKHKIEYNSSSNEIKLFSFHFDNKTFEKTNEYNIFKFNCNDIDPSAIVIKPYSTHSIMLQLIVKNNKPSVISLLINDEQVKSVLKVDRASIAYYNPIECKSKLERLKIIFINFFKLIQPKSTIVYQTDTSAMKTLTHQFGENNVTVDLSKMKKNEEHYVFGTMEHPPVFLNSRSPEETQINAKFYLKEKARNEKHFINGKVYLEFLIDENGKTKNAKIIKGVNKELEDLSIKLVEQMPDWKPGIIDGKNVSTLFITTIEY